MLIQAGDDAPLEAIGADCWKVLVVYHAFDCCHMVSNKP
jgi:hypothetical protein